VRKPFLQFASNTSKRGNIFSISARVKHSFNTVSLNPKGQHNIKRTAFNNHQAYTQNITMQSPRVAAWRYIARAFLQSVVIKAKSFSSTPTHGGDAFGLELTESHRFGSSGLCLAFRGLLLGARLRPSVKATSSNPHQLGPQFHVVFVCMRLFYRWSNGGRMLQRSIVEGSGE
jgi:hypothetical protein